VSAGEVAPLPATHFRADMTAEQRALAARADLDDLEAWAVRSEAILRACATAPTEGNP
jgi:hypothetical protein